MTFDLFNKPDGRTAILLPSGFVFDLTQPDAGGMPISDIAHCLAAQPRWGGATRPWYSVAEHCIMASYLVPPALAYDALMHDCEEFLGDWPSPVKVMLGIDFVKDRVRPIKQALRGEFQFDDSHPDVKHADLVCMATELRDLLPRAWMDWGHLPPPHGERIVPVGPERAYNAFLERYEELRAARLPARSRRTRGAQH
jgi:uncharacterized protein